MEPEQLAAMTPAQTARIRAKRLRALKPQVLGNMTPEAFARIPAGHLANLGRRLATDIPTNGELAGVQMIGASTKETDRKRNRILAQNR